MKLKHINELQKRNGLTFSPNQKIPYTGEALDTLNRNTVLFTDGVITRVTSWYENGQKREESFYKDGELDGEFTSWYENGQKKEESFYKDGELDGEFTSWYENGQKQEEFFYKDGERNGEATWWHDNGFKKGESFYKDGELNGEATWWHDNGFKKGEAFYKDGFRVGEFTSWYENGQKQEESFWKDGFRVGESTCWDGAGRKIFTNYDLPYFVVIFLSILPTYLIIDRYILIAPFFILLVAGLFFLLAIMSLLRIVVDRLNHHDKSRGDYAIAFTVIFIYAFVITYLI